ncbi:adhesion G protein-coupled receptor L3-like isoform X3 [Dysidea avara]
MGVSINVNISSTTDNSAVYTDAYDISQLNTTDDGRRYHCKVVINTTPPAMANSSVTLDVIVPTPNVTVGSPNICQPLTLECNVTTVRGVISRVDIIWSRGGVVLTRKNNTSVTIRKNSLLFIDTFNISTINTVDREYHCEVVINTTPPVMANGSVSLDLMVPSFRTAISPNVTNISANVGDALVLNCEVAILSDSEVLPCLIMFSWNGLDRSAETNDDRIFITRTSTLTSRLQFYYLMEGDEGRYTCKVNILGPFQSDIVFIRRLDIPTPSVNITTSNTQIVGQSLTLECNVTTVRGITSRVDIVWSRDGMVLIRRNQISPTMMPLTYTDIYNISQLNTSDDGRVYQCEVVINGSQPVMASDSVTLDVIVPPFHPTIHVSPTDTTQLHEVGNSLNLDCSVATVSGVEPSSIMFSWVGPDENAVTRDDRVLNPTTSGHTNSIQFTYLMEGDNGTYTCNVVTLGTNGSVSVVLALAVPTPNVTVTLPNIQMVGQPLTLECSVTTVRGITSRVDIIWSSDGLELERMEGVNINSTTDNSVVYTDTYTIPRLSTTDNGTVYQCEVMINTDPPVIADNRVTLDVISTVCNEISDVWGIVWIAQIPGILESQHCPNGASGEAYRRCLPNGVWDRLINITQCRHLVFTYLLERVNELINSPSSIGDVLNELQGISGELINMTTSTEVFLPNDLNTTIGIIDTITRLTQKSSEALTENDAKKVDVILDDVATTVSSILNDTNSISFRQSQNAGLPSIGEDFLRTIEKFAVAVGDVSSATNKSKAIPKDNIIIEAQLVPKNTTLIRTIVFPDDTMSEKFNRTQITIPRSALIHQRQTENASVPVVNFVAKNLQLNTSNNSLLSDSGVVISSQISQGPIDLTDRANHVTLKFELKNINKPECVYWNFSHESQSNQNTGRWSSYGIIQDNDPRPPVICNSTHLTSFSILVSSVDAAEDSPELRTISYVGCGVSIVCLLLTIGAIILLRKTAFKGKHHILHLNLSIALLIGLIVFVSGVETAVNSLAWCKVVAILLHYFFLSVFCWTLCEAILIYIKFVWIHYEGIFQDMRFFMILGWGSPIPIVAISAGVSHENYVIYGDRDEIAKCWISDEDGSIWAFITPVILILLINMILFTFSLWKIYRSAGGKMTQAVKEKYETAKVLLLSIIVLLPLLGATWILGLLFLIDNDSLVVAWIFTIVNSLQGVGIFFLHVVRSRELRNLIKRKVQKWNQDRKWKSSTTKDTTIQGQTSNSDNFLLQARSVEWDQSSEDAR